MFICPTCQSPLKRVRSNAGPFWFCPSCKSRAVNVSLLRKLIPAKIVNLLWQRARAGSFPRKRPCPFCTNKMTEIPIPNNEKTEYLDICPQCQFIFFDTGEYQLFPKNHIPKPETSTLSPQEKEKIALARLALLKAHEEKDKLGVSSPDNFFELIPAFFGLPIEYDNNTLLHRPIVTWTLSAIIAVISILAFFNLESVVTNWGLVPAQFLRHFGLTFVSSFFLHGSILHLVGNLYFLLIFGDNVEDDLGKPRFLLLIAIAALAGAITHILAEHTSTTPCIGASGGISAVIAYYALKFPKTHIGLLIFFRWVRLPVLILFFLWIASQLLGAYMQIAGFSRVSAFAHLGGAAIGILFWLTTKKD